MAHQRWESEGGALRRLGHERGNGAVAAEFQRCAVLSDDELAALRDIERRLRWESGARSWIGCSIHTKQPAKNHVDGSGPECSWLRPNYGYSNHVVLRGERGKPC